MNILEIIKLSIENLLSYKFRSFLTMLGIIMGIASVVLLTSLGQGFNSKLLDDAKLATSKILVVSIKEDALRKGEFTDDDYLTVDDAKKLSKIENIEATLTNEMVFLEEEKSGKYAQVIGINDEYLSFYEKKILKGQLFDTNTSSNVVLISQNTAKVLFNNQDPIGKEIKLISDTSDVYKVVGIFNGNYDKTADVFGASVPLEILMPHKLVNTYTGNYNNQFTEIELKFTNDKKVKNTIQVLQEYMNKRGSKKDLYEVKLLSDQFKEASSILDKVSLFINLVAGISIVVGGIGVMNIMLVSVKERITEIGLRKAIGAKNRDILIQFLIETVIITLIGGLIGVSIGYLLALLIGLVIKIMPILKLSVILTAFIISTVTGIVFGIYPAKQASKLSPMEALRKE